MRSHGERGIGVVLLGWAAWKIFSWPGFIASLRSVTDAWREPVAMALVILEGGVGLLLLVGRHDLVRVVVLLLWASAMCGGRLALSTPRSCRCLGPELPSWISGVTLVALWSAALLLLLVRANVDVARKSLCLAASAVTVIGGVVVAGALEGTPTWSLEGRVARDRGHYTVMVREVRGQSPGPTVTGATSTCECVSVVRIDGAAIEIAVHEAIPDGVLPYLRVDLLDLRGATVVELPLPVPLHD
jgi:hypothetical protein